MNAADANLPCGIGELPDELLLEILACLTPIRGFLSSTEQESVRRERNRKSVQALYSLTLACHRLHALATPFLYGSLIERTANYHTTALFLRTVMAKPQLVKSVNYIETQTRGSRNDDIPIDTSHQLWDQITKALKSPTWANRIDSIERYLSYPRPEGAVLEIFMVFLVSLADNLVELALDDPIVSYDALVKKPEKYRALRCVWLGRWEYPMEDCSPIIRGTPVTSQNFLLEFLRIHRGTSALLQDGHDLQDETKPDIELEEITLNDCNIAPEEVSRILQPCHSLKQFGCRWKSLVLPPRYNNDLGYDIQWAEPIDLVQLQGDLYRFKNSLETLVLDTLDSGWQVSLEQDIPSLGSLREFTALKHLDVSGLVLWGDDDTSDYPSLASILPASLETLVIQVEWDDYVEESLIGLSQECAFQLPSLKTVDCSWRPAPTHIVGELIAAFGDVGVALKLSCAEG